MTEQFYLTKKKRKLTGKRLETFNKFWEVFNYRRGKAEAADAWLDIPTLTDSIVSDILLGAKAEAMARQRLIDSGRTPKMAQGWITARRWEDDLGQKMIDKKPKVSANGIDNMIRAYNLLCNVSEDAFHQFCEGVRMEPNDKEAVLNKYNMAFDVKQLAKTAVRGV
jgi:hypothetical protein